MLSWTVVGVHHGTQPARTLLLQHSLIISEVGGAERKGAGGHSSQGVGRLLLVVNSAFQAPDLREMAQFGHMLLAADEARGTDPY